MDLTVREQRRLLASATARRDPAALQDDAVRATAVRWPQSGGQLLLALGTDGGPAAAQVRAQVLGALQRRGWTGDDVLIDQLEGRLAALAHVDLDQLASALDGAEGGVLDLHDGSTLPMDVVMDNDLDDDGPDSVEVPGLATGEAWRDRRSFVDTLPESRVRERLAEALEGRGAFRRFGRELDRHEELIAPFLAWRDERAAGRARAWLRDQGLLEVQ